MVDDTNSGFEMFEPCDVDDGELDGLRPNECFVLGVEWQMLRELGDGRRGFARPVHAANADRIRKLLDRRGRTYTLTYMENDVSESWMWLDVAPKNGADESPEKGGEE